MRSRLIYIDVHSYETYAQIRSQGHDYRENDLENVTAEYHCELGEAISFPSKVLNI